MGQDFVGPLTSQLTMFFEYEISIKPQKIEKMYIVHQELPFNILSFNTLLISFPKLYWVMQI